MFKRRSLFINGFTLIELLIALLLSTLIISGVSAIYLACERGNQIKESLLQIEQASRIAIAILTQALRLSGDFNCQKIQHGTLNAFQDGQGFSVTYLDPHSAKILTDMHDRSSIFIPLNWPVKVNDALLITDCQSSAALTVKTITTYSDSQMIQATTPLAKNYLKNAEVSHIKNESYFVAPTDRLDKYQQKIYSLYVSAPQKKAELVEGVAQLNLTYAVLENGVLVIKPADAITKDAQIMGVSLRFKLHGLQYYKLYKTEFAYVALS